MEITCTINTDQIDPENGIDFETLITDALRREIINNTKNKVASEKFQEFARLTSDTIVSEIKLRMQNFLDDDIVLTNDWGKKRFVGSVDNLIQTKVDDILTKPVNNDGKEVQGCTSSTQTWVEWAIKNEIRERQNRLIQDAAKTVEKTVKDAVTNRLNELKDGAIKKQVGEVFASYLSGGK